MQWTPGTSTTIWRIPWKVEQLFVICAKRTGVEMGTKRTGNDNGYMRSVAHIIREGKTRSRQRYEKLKPDVTMATIQCCQVLSSAIKRCIAPIVTFSFPDDCIVLGEQHHDALFVLSRTAASSSRTKMFWVIPGDPRTCARALVAPAVAGRVAVPCPPCLKTVGKEEYLHLLFISVFGFILDHHCAIGCAAALSGLGDRQKCFVHLYSGPPSLRSFSGQLWRLEYYLPGAPGRSRRRSRTPPIFGPAAPAAARAPAAYLAAAPRVPRRCPPVHVPNNVPNRYSHPVDASASRCRAPALPSDRLSGPDVFRRWGSSCNEGRLE
ncbi:hypothetical protein B0H14DRAFT_2566888 [Mycena olivaceomarginata]|nr:hypothetical protein B0H14DRAFT_2566888 [Mycena olivaceomarginata]